ncbi:MAG: diaminopimelate decarboxylase [Candidatus Abyssobacteria bacterium SURF_17]|uniref:Diaminopimelate decarboxylase n=1 Tax=Candidatus Abyssobacteria bacterium SURF_17 TaxID=2093361 RepID=A0A419F9V7_9BACT|nr:MAG: diaminopimelate decarboxylase [Candidatus Abyssubacteria bacterium SURF_17]
MNLFGYREGTFWCESVPIPQIAEKVGTPFYLYSKNTLLRHYQRLDESLAGIDHIICYALKANPSLSVCKVLADAGSGAEIVSGGELYRALRVGVSPGKIVYNGNGKTAPEIRYALESGILMFNVDSESELHLLNQIANELGCTAHVGLRVNPDIDPRTHPYISTGLRENKFGIPIEEALEFYRKANAMPNVKVVGIHKHIGSQIVDLSPFVESLQRIMLLVKELSRIGVHLRCIDMGGGIGITYNEETPPSFEDYVSAIKPLIKDSGCMLIVEPGRVIVGNAGVLITRVVHVKASGNKNFVVVDAAMNDLIRPSIYGAYHNIVPVEQSANCRATIVADVVGGICESADFFARGREVPELKAGELVAIMSAGAYGAAMASNYNSRPLIAEVMVDGSQTMIIRRRQTYEEMVSLESF